MPNLQDITRFDERWSYLYLEKGQLDRDASSLVFRQSERETPVPLDLFATLMLGPGTTVTAAAMKLCAEGNCLLCWSGEDGTRLYAHGAGGTHSSHRLLAQVELYADPKARLAVIRRMYAKSFGYELPSNLNLQQMRGMEGKRVQRIYEDLAQQHHVPWDGRRYKQEQWDWADPLNRAISVANALLHGLCHAAILSAGYSPAVGFIHTGKMLSFVYDVADFYKTQITIPLAFQTVAESTAEVERRTRIYCRNAFFAADLTKRVLPDISEVLNAGDHLEERAGELEGRAVSLADRSGGGSVPGQSVGPDTQPPLGQDLREAEGGLRSPDLE